MLSGANCIHHWIIDSKQHGVCKHCGAEKDFPGLADVENGTGWRRPHTVSEDSVKGGGDMADKYPSELAGLDLDEARERVAQQTESQEGTDEELAKAQQAGVELKTKTKKEKKPRRHDPNGKLKKVWCTWPGCIKEMDPRYLHLHIHLVHKGLLPSLRTTPQPIVDKILKWFDAGMRQRDILIKLQKEEGETLTSTRLQTLLNRERPDREKWRRNKRQATLTLGAGILSGSTDQEPEKVDQKVDSTVLLLEVMKLIVDGMPAKQIHAKAGKVKKELEGQIARLAATLRLLDGVMNYAADLIVEADQHAGN